MCRMRNDQPLDRDGAAIPGLTLDQREQMLALDPDAGAPIKLSPTDIAQYIRLAQCRRYLRLRLVERNSGKSFMPAWDTQPQSIPPLLTLSGRDFEGGAEAEIGKVAPISTCSRDDRTARGTDSDNQQLIDLARNLAPGERIVVFQPLLKIEIDGWDLTGIADAIDLRRAATSALSASSSTSRAPTPPVWSTACKSPSIARCSMNLPPEGLTPEIELGILYRGAPGDESQPDDPKLIAQLDDALETFGVNGFLERIEDPNALRRDVRALVLGKSEARRNLSVPFDELPYHLNYVCDGCLYNQLCLRQSAETDDLSLIPFLRADQKQNLHTAGVRHCADLAGVPLPAEMESTEYRKLAMAPALGANLDDLIERARTYRSSKGDPYKRNTWLPDPGQSSIPRCDENSIPI